MLSWDADRGFDAYVRGYGLDVYRVGVQSRCPEHVCGAWVVRCTEYLQNVCATKAWMGKWKDGGMPYGMP